MKTQITSLLASVTVVALVAPAYAQQEGQLITEVVVRGTRNTAKETAELTAGLNGVKKGSPFSRTAVEKAKKALIDKGLYANVLIRPELAPGNTLRLVIDVVENPRINYVTITGNRAIKTEDLLKQIGSKPNDILNRTTLAEDAIKIQRYYRSKGYNAIVAQEPQLDEKTGIVTIPLIETVVEAIDVEGLRKTKKNVVLRELRTKVGDPYNEFLLREDLSRVANTGLFLDVIQAPPEPTEIGKVRVIIPVQEQQTGQFNVSFGYSQQQRLTGTLSVDEVNFRGKGQNLSASWTVAGGLSRNAYQFSFAEPWVDKNNTSVRFSIYDQFQFRFNRGFSNNFTDGLNSNQYFETRRGGSLSISRPLTADRFTRGFATVRSERTDANNLASNYQQLTDLEIAQFRGALIQNGNVNAITLGMTANPVDNVLDPSRGYYFQPSIEVGRSQFDFRKPFLNPAYVDATTTPNIDRVLLESRSQSGAFAKYSVDYRRYFSLDGKPRVNLGEGKKVFATRLLYGTAIGNISFAEQYFMGGVDNLRGYQNERFWGNNQFLLSNELRLPLDKQANTVGVFFVDIGDAWGAADVNRENIAGFEQHRSFKPSVGLGIGLRVRTPLGPIRLDYGFGRGGRGVSHFSIGQAF